MVLDGSDSVGGLADREILVMCSVSMIGDHYRDMWQSQPWFNQIPTGQPYPLQPPITIYTPPEISRAEFDELKRQVSEMKELLKRAKKYDEDNGEPECEVDEKMDVLRRVAKIVGVSLDDVISKRV